VQKRSFCRRYDSRRSLFMRLRSTARRTRVATANPT
jgi:hypothetical protein